MSALNIFYDRLMQHFKEVEIGVFTLRPRALPILQQETIVNEIYLMPAPTELLFQYDAVVDLSNMTGWPIFKQEMIDFYLQAMSITPESVSPEEKRCFIKLNERVVHELEPMVKALKAVGKKLLLYHPLSSSPIRSIPAKIMNKHLKYLLDETDFLIVTLLELDFKDKRLVNLANYSRKGFDYFAYLISQMDAIITVDTAVYHVADAFSVPTVVHFTSIPPAHRISYYPYQKGILIGERNGEPLFYRHHSQKEDEVKALELEWRKLKIKEVLDLLEELVSFRQKIPQKICPICGNMVPFIPADRYRSYRHLSCSQCEAEFAWPRKGHDYEKVYEMGQTDVARYDYYLGKDPEKQYQGLINNPRFSIVKEFLVSFPHKKNLLDVGCSNGFLVKFAREIGFSAYGIDAASIAVSYGKKNFGLRNCLALAKSLDELPKHFPKKYQIITAFELIEHLEDPLTFVKDVFEYLEPGGIFIFSTPNKRLFARRMGLKDPRRFYAEGNRDAPPEHLTRLTLKTHRVLVEKAGFSVLWQRAQHPLPGDIGRVLGEQMLLPNLNIDLGNGQKIVLEGSKLKPYVLEGMKVLLPLLEEQGFFIFTAAIKDV